MLLKIINLLIRINNRLCKSAYKIVDVNKYRIAKISDFLVVEKNKFLITKRPNTLFENNKALDNTETSWDSHWGDSEVIDEFMNNKEVISFFDELSDIINNKINAGVFLDAGCGAGKFLKILKSKSKDKSIEFYGSDFSQSSIEYCINNYKDVEFKISDIYEMDYKDDFADYIVCSEVLEHLIEPEKALNELIRVCKTDGFIFLTVPNGELDDFIGHTNFWSFSEFKKFLEKFELDFELILIENNKSFLAIIKNRKIL